jgi:hypothetical protein
MSIRSCLLDSLIIGVIYLGYPGLSVMGQNSGYDRFPPVANSWGTIHPVPGDDPTNPDFGAGAINLERTNPGNDTRHHFPTL